MDVKIFTMGGTIDKVYFDAKSRYEVGDSNVDRLLTEVKVGFDYHMESLFKKDSLELTDEDRQHALDRIRAEACDKILITHGTDTMVETARVLQATPGKTIVLTGAMQPLLFKDSDAVFNIGFALGVLMSRSPGVYIAMNGGVFSPQNVRKNRAAGIFEQVEASST